VKAAYLDHLKNVVNIDLFMARNEAVVAEQAEAGAKDLIDYVMQHDYAKPVPPVFMDEENEEIVKRLVKTPS